MKKNIVVFVLLILAASSVNAESCHLDVIVGDNMNFVPANVEVSKSACPSVTVNLSHNGKLPKNVMGHNWVLTKTEDAQSVAQAGWGAGLDKQYLPKGDKRIIAGTDIIGGGEKTSVSFTTAELVAGGDYSFFCSFVGHFAIMKGKFTLTK